MTGERGNVGTSCLLQQVCCAQLPSPPASLCGGMEMVKADHSCRGSLCCPPAPRTPSQIVAECKRTQEVSWRRLETHQGRVEEGCCPGQREGNVPQAALPSVSEMGTQVCSQPCCRASSSNVGKHTEGPNGFSQSASHPAGVPLHQSTHIISLMPGHSLSGPFPAPAHHPGYGLRHNLTPSHGDQ